MSDIDWPEDSDLAERMRGGDQGAVAELIERHGERLRHILRFRMDPRLAGRVEVDDLLQEIWVAAAARLQHYATDKAPPFLWLRLVALQSLVDLHRHHCGAQMRDVRKERALAMPRGMASSTVTIARMLIGVNTSPSQAAARNDLVERVEQAIGELSEMDQEVIALRHFEELSNNEVAELLGIEVKAASIRYVRAVKRLKAAVERIPGLRTELFHGA